MLSSSCGSVSCCQYPVVIHSSDSASGMHSIVVYHSFIHSFIRLCCVTVFSIHSSSVDDGEIHISLVHLPSGVSFVFRWPAISCVDIDSPLMKRWWKIFIPYSPVVLRCSVNPLIVDSMCSRRSVLTSVQVVCCAFSFSSVGVLLS